MRRILSALVLLAGLAAATAQPTILFEPKGQSASLGAQTIFIVVAYGPEPITYRWFKNGTLLNGQTEDALVIASVSLADAGDYTVEASSASGSITSDIATLHVDPTFHVIRSPEFVRSGGSSTGASWVDYDQDGDLDLFICRAGLEPNQLHRNNGDGTFTQTPPGPNNVTDIAGSRNGAWADYNNDGFPDLYVANTQNDFLYENNGDGTFTRIFSGPIVTSAGQTFSGGWSDYDRDGFLDLVVGNSFQANGQFRNLGDGTFANVTGTPITGEGFRTTTSIAWADYDNDNDPDLLIANGGGFGNANEIIYRNNGSGAFTRIATGAPTQSGGNSTSASWADYDNDLDLDLFVSNTAGQNNALHRNNGDGTFTTITTGEIVSDGGDSEGAAWADYDNDGFVDLFVVNNNGQQNFLYHNNGDGTFSRVLTGTVGSEFANSFGCAWGDYNNDGFLDLFVSKQGGNNSLFQNAGNGNAWIVIKPIGRVSNRGGVGAKVKVLATIGGAPRWQMREISARGSEGSPSTGYAEFGLGDASVIDTLRIEWPSGLQQEVHNVDVRQYTAITEPPTITIAGTTTIEGDAGTKLFSFPVRLGAPTNQIVTVEYFTSDGSAVAGQDYIATNGVLSFAPGETNQVVSVEVIGDLVDETNRVFFVTISNATVMPIAVPLAQGTIIDDDPLLFTITDISPQEGSSGLTTVMVPVSLQKPVDYPVSADYITVSSAALTNDYVHTNGTITFEPGQTQKFVVVHLVGDNIDELTETIFVNFSNGTNVVLIDRQGSIAIQDDDPAPVLSVADVSVQEGNSGTNHALFTARLDRPSSQTVGFTFATSNVTAIANGDYVSRTLSRTMPPGTTNLDFFVIVNGDTTIENNETFMVTILSMSNAVPGRIQAFATIVDDDLQLAPMKIAGPGAALKFPSIPGREYVVEWTAALDANPVWTPLSSGTGTGAPIEVVDPDGTAHRQRFYRVRFP